MTRKSPDFDIRNEFQVLDSEDKTAILASIKKFQLTEVTSEDKLEKSELAKQEMYRRLKNVTIAKDKLQGSEEIKLNKADELRSKVIASLLPSLGFYIFSPILQQEEVTLK